MDVNFENNLYIHLQSVKLIKKIIFLITFFMFLIIITCILNELFLYPKTKKK